MNKKSFSKIWIIVIVIILIVGGVLVWQCLFQTSKTPGLEKLGETSKGIEKPALNITTGKLTTIPEGYQLTGYPEFSSNGERIFFRAEKDGKQFIFLDGIKSNDYYDDINNPVFSADGKRFACAITKDGKRFMFFDEEPFDGNPDKLEPLILLLNQQTSKPGDIIFSPDGNHLVYVKVEGKTFIVILDNKIIGNYELPNFVSQLTFSLDGNHFAYEASEEDKHFVVLDGKKQKEYDEQITWLTFSKDGKHLAYATVPVSSFGKQKVILDNEEIGSYENVHYLTFSPDSNHLAFISDGVEKDILVVDGKEITTHDLIESFIFLGDNQIAYVTKKGSFDRVLVVGNKESKTYPKITNLTLSLDGKHLAYVAGEIYGEELVVLDDKEGKKYKEIRQNDLVFSPDSQHLAYRATTKEGEDVVVLDDKEGKNYDFSSSQPIFSPDSQHLACIAYPSLKSNLLVLDGKEIPFKEMQAEKFLIYTDPIFSTDSAYVSYGAKINNELWWIVEEVK